MKYFGDTLGNNELVNNEFVAKNALPDREGQAGKFLTTDGTNAIWSNINGIRGDLNITGNAYINCTDIESHTVSANIAANSFLVGDANGDGEVSISDTTHILKYVEGKIEFTTEEKIRSDANEDGLITSDDSTLVLRYVSQIIMSLPHKYVTYANIPTLSKTATILKIDGITYGNAVMLEDGIVEIFSDVILTEGTPITVTYMLRGPEVENMGNKVAAFQTTPDNAHYPTEKLVKDSLDEKYDADNPAGYITGESAELTGIPTAPTPDATINNTQIATTAFVHNVITAALSKSY